MRVFAPGNVNLPAIKTVEALPLRESIRRWIIHERLALTPFKIRSIRRTDKSQVYCVYSHDGASFIVKHHTDTLAYSNEVLAYLILEGCEHVAKLLAGC